MSTELRQCQLSISPALPPPPPPPPPVSQPKIICTKKQLAENLRILQECHEEISATKRCSNLLNSSYGEEKMCFSLYRPVKSVIQEGPQCGLVALSMASQILNDENLDMEIIVNSAKTLGFTKQGEMFSASNMCSLATRLIQCSGQVIETSLAIYTRIISKPRSVLLIPYDKYHNHEPCNRRGHNAHWAIISGVILVTDKDALVPSLIAASQQDATNPNVYHINESSRNSVKEAKQHITDVYVYASQGKSIHTHIWCLDTLIKSNKQLVELGLSIDVEHYVVGVEGIQGGLCGKAVLLTRD